MLNLGLIANAGPLYNLASVTLDFAAPEESTVAALVGHLFH